MTVMSETYFSIDIETDGVIPGLNSMISLGCVAFNHEGKEIGEFSENCFATGECQDPDTMAWWKTQPAAWIASTTNPQPVDDVMKRFVDWAEKIAPRRAVAMAQPAGFDWTFVYWYLRKFGHRRSPFNFQCLDIKTYAMVKLGVDYRDAVKRNMPPEWFKGLPPHTHKAVDDAREQGMLFFRMRDWVKP